MIPCFNSADFVGHAINSALEQSRKQIEIVVVNDGSQDESASVISSFGSRIRRIELTSNKGGAFARNRGADASSGEFFLFLDADDLLGSDAVSSLVDASLARPGCVAAARFSYLVPDDDGWKRAPARRRIYSDGDQLLGWLEGNWTPPCGLLWPRSAYVSVGGWNESLTRNDDGDIVMRGLCRGVRITSASDGEVFYRRHKNTRASLSTMRSSDSHLRSAFTVLTDLSRELERQGRLQNYSGAISEDLAEIGLLAFRAGFNKLGGQTVAAVRALRSRQEASLELAAAASPAVDKHAVARDRIYASTIRGRGQLRRWMKRRSS